MRTGKHWISRPQNTKIHKCCGDDDFTKEQKRISGTKKINIKESAWNRNNIVFRTCCCKTGARTPPTEHAQLHRTHQTRKTQTSSQSDPTLSQHGWKCKEDRRTDGRWQEDRRTDQSVNQEMDMQDMEMHQSSTYELAFGAKLDGIWHASNLHHASVEMWYMNLGLPVRIASRQ